MGGLGLDGMLFVCSAWLCCGLLSGRNIRTELQEALSREKRLRDTERIGRITAERRLREQVSAENEAKGFRFKAIGHIQSIYPDRRGTPRQPILVTAGRGRIVFDKHQIQHEHYSELSQFSHIWVVFVFHENTNITKDDRHNSTVNMGKRNVNMKGVKNISAKIAPPRLHGTKVGCLSTRSPHRPNPIGLSVCAIEDVQPGFIEISGTPCSFQFSFLYIFVFNFVS